MADPDLERALVGGREKRPIEIVDYDPSWPRRFDRERNRVAEALGAAALRIEHIGSTAVPGLAAKPIVDLLIAVPAVDDAATIPALRKAGYELRVREPGHLMFRTPERDVHIHVWGAGDPEIERHLLFRDHLREHVSDRRSYERCKRELAARDWADMNEYANAKRPLIDAILARAAEQA